MLHTLTNEAKVHHGDTLKCGKDFLKEILTDFRRDIFVKRLSINYRLLVTSPFPESIFLVITENLTLTKKFNTFKNKSYQRSLPHHIAAEAIFTSMNLLLACMCLSIWLI